MRNQIAPEQRKKLQKQVLTAFKTEMKNLSKELQQILADDIVTAFQNRIAVFQPAPKKTSQKRG